MSPPPPILLLPYIELYVHGSLPIYSNCNIHDSNLRVCDIDSSAFYLLSTSTFLTSTKLWYVCDIDSSDFYLLSTLTFLICTKLWYAFILGLRLFPNAYKRYEPRLYIDLFTISMSLRKFVKSRLDIKWIAMHILRKP